MSGIVSVYVTFPSDEEARRVGRTLVEERFAACVNILGACHSIYRWHGKIEEAKEVAAIFKTTAGEAPLLLQRLGQLHSYEIPAATVSTVSEVPETYRSWVVENSGR